MTVRQRVRDYVTGPEFPVVATAIVVAIPAAYLVQGALDAAMAFGYLLLLGLGVGVPRLYDYWPRTHGRLGAVAWAVAACAVMAGEMAALYLLVEPVIGGFAAAAVAFVVADLGSTILLAVAGGTTPN